MDSRLFTREEIEKMEIFRNWKKALDEVFRPEMGGISGEVSTRLLAYVYKTTNTLRAFSGEISPEVAKPYKDLTLRTKFFLLHLLSEKEIVELFEEHFLFGWKLGIDLLDRLRALLFSMPQIQKDREEFLVDLRKALHRNKEILGMAKVKTDSNETSPYLSFWLTDWENTFGRRAHSHLEIADYLYKSLNVKSLASQERKILKDILEFYEQLKLPITHPASFAAYSLSTFGIGSRGFGLQKRFMPTRPDMVAAYEEYQRRKIGEMQGATAQKTTIAANVPETGGKGFRLVRNAPQRKATKEVVQEPTAPTRKTIPASAPRVEEFEEDFGMKKTLSTGDLDAAIAKLNSAEGLGTLTIGDFRLFSPNPKEAARFMFHKVRKLVIDRPAERTKIRQNFNNSEIYKLYLSQGKEALDTKNSISLVAEQRKKQSRPYLSEEEYKAIAAVGRAI